MSVDMKKNKVAVVKYEKPTESLRKAVELSDDSTPESEEPVAESASSPMSAETSMQVGDGAPSEGPSAELEGVEDRSEEPAGDAEATEAQPSVSETVSESAREVARGIGRGLGASSGVEIAILLVGAVVLALCVGALVWIFR